MKRRRFFPALAAIVAAPVATIKAIGGPSAGGYTDKVEEAVWPVDLHFGGKPEPEWRTYQRRIKLGDVDRDLNRLLAESFKRDEENAIEALSKPFFTEV